MFMNIRKISQEMKKKTKSQLYKTFVLKNNDLESSFDENCKDVLKNQF